MRAAAKANEVEKDVPPGACTAGVCLLSAGPYQKDPPRLWASAGLVPTWVPQDLASLHPKPLRN